MNAGAVNITDSPGQREPAVSTGQCPRVSDDRHDSQLHGGRCEPRNPTPPVTSTRLIDTFSIWLVWKPSVRRALGRHVNRRNQPRAESALALMIVCVLRARLIANGAALAQHDSYCLRSRSGETDR